MGEVSVRDILVTSLAEINVPGGNVLHAIKAGDAGYEEFGEAYFSWISNGAIKAWKRHTKMTMNLIVPTGMVEFAFCSPENINGAYQFRVEEIGVDRYARITVPPGIWFGFKGLGTSKSLILNVASIPHDLNEVERLPLGSINYKWDNL